MDLKFRCLIRNVDNGMSGELIVVEVLNVLRTGFMNLPNFDLLDIRSSMFDQESNNPWVYVFGRVHVSGIMSRFIGRKMVTRGSYKIKKEWISNHFEDVHIHFYSDIGKIYR
ncbi:gamma protein [Puchong virus]|uniref:Gamma protein n=1 Tax=Puchong virus TaxID=1272955 RepID=A0A7D0IUJ5_9RHAB|nr:gamma protein [Puchong virus]QEA08647.1 gamma protein [Puchong virus]